MLIAEGRDLRDDRLGTAGLMGGDAGRGQTQHIGVGLLRSGQGRHPAVDHLRLIRGRAELRVRLTMALAALTGIDKGDGLERTMAVVALTGSDKRDDLSLRGSVMMFDPSFEP